MYVIAVSKVMYNLRESLSEERFVSSIEVNEQMHELYEVGYVDDLLAPIDSLQGCLSGKPWILFRFFGVFVGVLSFSFFRVLECQKNQVF